jgi:prevent-host-death family protein
MYMSETVGVAELRRNLSTYLRRVSRGERLLVTDRNRPVAELGPAPATGPDLDRLIAAGRVPLGPASGQRPLSRALDEVRGDF